MPNVKIRIEKGKETAGDGRENQEAQSKDREQAVASPTQMLFYHQMIATGKQALSFATSNIANFTGNQMEQEKVNDSMQLVGDLTTLGLGATRGWAGLIVAGIGLATKYTLQGISLHQENVHAKREYDYLAKRSGNTTTNGSRGTEN